MNRKTAIKKLASRINLMLPCIYSEELTAHALVIPFLQIVGSDEEMPESGSSISMLMKRRNGHSNFAIFQYNRLNIMVAYSHHQYNMDDCKTFLNDYWKKFRSKFGLITNGIKYEMYSAAMIYRNDYSKPLFNFCITTTHAGKINSILNQYQDLLVLN
ncbi:hypothetical protein [Pedobacter sp. KLB.chiD]|uniref:hypothetical protein n=1 Tax=Pedobacter sp. KLB.chiD TaxID=3387402 RepID=UPI00399A5BC9